MFKGSLVAMITPFTKNDEVDEKGIEIPFPRQVVYLRKEKGVK